MLRGAATREGATRVDADRRAREAADVGAATTGDPATVPSRVATTATTAVAALTRAATAEAAVGLAVRRSASGRDHREAGSPYSGARVTVPITQPARTTVAEAARRSDTAVSDVGVRVARRPSERCVAGGAEAECDGVVLVRVRGAAVGQRGESVGRGARITAVGRGGSARPTTTAGDDQVGRAGPVADVDERGTTTATVRAVREPCLADDDVEHLPGDEVALCGDERTPSTALVRRARRRRTVRADDREAVAARCRDGPLLDTAVRGDLAAERRTRVRVVQLRLRRSVAARRACVGEAVRRLRLRGRRCDDGERDPCEEHEHRERSATIPDAAGPSGS